MKIAFYFVDEDYIRVLKDAEMKARGFTTVPNMTYHRTDKFVYGVVLTVKDLNYYVPFSHYEKRQEDNVLVVIKDHGKNHIAGSLRFNYMFPVPKRCLRQVVFSDFDQDRQILLRKEYKACLSMLSRIQKRAMKTYTRVVEGRDEELINNSCMFLLLEQVCREYPVA